MDPTIEIIDERLVFGIEGVKRPLSFVPALVLLDADSNLALLFWKFLEKQMLRNRPIDAESAQW